MGDGADMGKGSRQAGSAARCRKACPALGDCKPWQKRAELRNRPRYSPLNPLRNPYSRNFEADAMSSNILIVEDEFLIAIAMEQVLEDLGHSTVGIADDMNSALTLASADIDFALVDVNLADGATGPLIGERLASDFGIGVVFVTANPAQLGDGVAGALGAVEKPLDVNTLAEVLDFALACSRGEHPAPPPRLRLFEHTHAA